ncbi:XkdQ/YqbQ family protein [Lactobacillus kalixensis]|uniref:XkdQ/YqbQ family protein n=1 Tax=Lactobacillus kalixensis TaxID=227944 RepID=UPI00070DC43E|nr:hypothetical protein [Lactobacillus kalixensis]
MSDNIKMTLRRRSTHFTHSKSRASYDISDLVVDDSITWDIDTNFSATEFKFKLVFDTKPVIPYTGDIITFTWKKTKIFYGYVFNYGFDKDHNINVKCYGPSRYLKNEDSIVFKAGTLSDRFKEVCKRAGIKAKVVASASHKCKAEINDGKTYFDMIKSAISTTTKSTHKHYLIFDHYDTVELRKFPYKKLDIVIGDQSGLIDYDYSVDIDNTYNVVEVVKKDAKKSKKTSKTKTSKDDPKNTTIKSKTVSMPSSKQWGKLQKVVNAKKKANDAQMIQQAKNELKNRNMANKELKITCVGRTDLIPGNYVTISIKDYKKKFKDCPILKATHHFGQDYTVDLTMKVGKSWQVSGSMS